MKKTNRLVTIFLMVCMVLASGGLLYATMYASGAGTQSTQTTVAFDAPSGIRYNELTGAFEVFSGVGVSWIGSNGWVSTLGNYDKSTGNAPSQTPTTGVWYKATRTATYNIMCDIAYKSVYVPGSITTFVAAYNEAFNNGITLEAGGKIYGRGFFLKGFPVRNADKSSALIATNNGTIRNVNIIDAHFVKVTGTEFTSVGILCAINGSNGVIDDCAVYGEYSSDKFPSMYGIAAENNGTIMNCSNNAKLINSGTGDTFTAGITEVLANSNVVNNINNGELLARTVYSSSAGIAFCKSDVEGIVSGNVNNALVTAMGTAVGVLGGVENPVVLRTGGNTNNGDLIAEETFFNYHGKVFKEANPDAIPPNGIRWNPDLGLFEIYNSAGVSHISMGYWFNAEGLMRTTSATDYKQATMESHYRIMNDIVYNASEPGFNQHFATVLAGKAPRIGVGGIVDGGGHTLSGFPIRALNENVGGKAAHSAFLLYTRGLLTSITFNFDCSYSPGDNDSLAGVAVGASGVMKAIGVTGYIERKNEGSASATGVIVCASNFYGPTTDETTMEDGILETSWSSLRFVSPRVCAPLGNGSAQTHEYTVNNFINFGDVQAGSYAAGIGVWVSSAVVYLNNCINYGKIESTVGVAAGCVTRVPYDGLVDGGLVNYGEIIGYSAAGGIYGQFDVNRATVVQGVKNYGNVYLTGTGVAGAIVGEALSNRQANLTLKNCENYGGVGHSKESLQYGSDAVLFGANPAFKHGDANGNISIDIRNT